jgi:CDP-6-deoxy-D-xylo-4-hexulose-3-dehydrase
MIVAVNVLGNPAALDVIRDFADRHCLYLLEDNCESMDAELNGRKTGTFGDLNTFSFFYSHHISTMEGGMVLTNSIEYDHLLRSRRIVSSCPDTTSGRWRSVAQSEGNN